MSESEFMQHIAESLRARRKAAGYKSVAALCEQLEDMNPKRYYEYESGRTPIPIDVAVQVAAACGCTLDELVGRDSEEAVTSMTAEEAELLECYAQLDALGRQTVLMVARNAAAAKGLGRAEAGDTRRRTA